jgi:hypothetical protein
LQSSAETKSPGLRGGRKLLDLSNFFGAGSGSPSSFPTAGFSFPTTTFQGFNGENINNGPSTTIMNNFNSGNFEGAGGKGGAAAFGGGSTAFDLDDVSNLQVMNSGSTISSGGSFGFVGLNPEEGAADFASLFGANAFGFGGGGGGSSSGGGT